MITNITKRDAVVMAVIASAMASSVLLMAWIATGYPGAFSIFSVIVTFIAVPAAIMFLLAFVSIAMSD